MKRITDFVRKYGTRIGVGSVATLGTVLYFSDEIRPGQFATREFNGKYFGQPLGSGFVVRFPFTHLTKFNTDGYCHVYIEHMFTDYGKGELYMEAGYKVVDGGKYLENRPDEIKWLIENEMKQVFVDCISKNGGYYETLNPPSLDEFRDMVEKELSRKFEDKGLQFDRVYINKKFKDPESTPETRDLKKMETILLTEETRQELARKRYCAEKNMAEYMREHLTPEFLRYLELQTQESLKLKEMDLIRELVTNKYGSRININYQSNVV